MMSTAGDYSDSFIIRGVESTTGKEIGRGAYGRVFEVNFQGTPCAAKEIHILLQQHAQGEVLRKMREDFVHECQIWYKLRHPCIVQFLGVYYTGVDRLPIMVMEKMHCSLRSLVEQYESIPMNVKLSILHEVCLGLRYLHSRSPAIIHRDLTPNNILLSYCLEAKITDLGVAKVLKPDDQRTMTQLPGTPDFMPPEAQNKRPVYGPPLDVFSYGGVILYVTTQLWPEPTDATELNPDSGRREVVSEVKRRQQYLDKMTGGAADLKQLVMSCLDDNPENRPLVAKVSTRISELKDVYSQKFSSYDGMSLMAWWAARVASGEQQLQEQLKREIDKLKAENDTIKDENKQLKADIDVLKDTNKKLTRLWEGVNSDNECNMEQLCVQGNKLSQLEIEVHQVKQQLVLKDSPATTKWKEASPIPVGCVGHTAIWLNGLVYVGGGHEAGVGVSFTIYIYDPVNSSWSAPLNAPYCQFAMTTLNNNLLIAGGKDKSNRKTNQILMLTEPSDASYDQFNSYTKMTKARSSPAAVGHQGMLIIAGGKDNKNKVLSSTELFDSSNEQWYSCNSLPQPMHWMQSVIVDNSLYLLGGLNKDGDSSAVFTASLNNLSRHQLKWSTHQDTPYCQSVPVSVHDKYLLIVGGCKMIGGCYTSDVYMLNKVSRSWETMGKIPSVRKSSAAVSIDDHRIIVIGGENDNREVANTVWIGSCEPHY